MAFVTKTLKIIIIISGANLKIKFKKIKFKKFYNLEKKIKMASVKVIDQLSFFYYRIRVKTHEQNHYEQLNRYLLPCLI